MFRELKFWYDFRIIFQGLEHAIAGTDLHVVKPGDDSKDNIGHEQEWKECEGVYVPRSLEALLEVLKTENILLVLLSIAINP
jgi:hypothetical protein